jgi:hypothetical protein
VGGILGVCKVIFFKDLMNYFILERKFVGQINRTIFYHETNSKKVVIRYVRKNVLAFEICLKFVCLCNKTFNIYDNDDDNDDTPDRDLFSKL